MIAFDGLYRPLAGCLSWLLFAGGIAEGPSIFAWSLTQGWHRWMSSSLRRSGRWGQWLSQSDDSKLPVAFGVGACAGAASGTLRDFLRAEARGCMVLCACRFGDGIQGRDCRFLRALCWTRFMRDPGGMTRSSARSLTCIERRAAGLPLPMRRDRRSCRVGQAWLTTAGPRRSRIAPKARPNDCGYAKRMDAGGFAHGGARCA